MQFIFITQVESLQAGEHTHTHTCNFGAEKRKVLVDTGAGLSVVLSNKLLVCVRSASNAESCF